MANYDPQNFKSVILYMRNEFGASVFRDASRMYATFCELSPKLESYGNIMRQLIERGALAELEAASGDDKRQAEAMTKARDILENKLLLSADRAGDFLGVLGTMYGAPPPKRSKPKQSAKKKPSGKCLQWGECGGDGYSVRYERYENGLLVFSGSGPIRDFEVRERRDGTWYCNTPWWNQRKAISRLKIPDGVTGIGDFAFEGCENLISVVIPNSVTYIGEGAFADCAGLTSVVIPDSVTQIEEYAFADCARLTSVVIPDSVTEIGWSAFAGCAELTSVVIPDSVTEIGWGAFAGCAELTSVVIPDSVTEIGLECGGFISHTSIGDFEGFFNNRDTFIRDFIGSFIKGFIGAFEGCTELTSVVIPNSVTEIGRRAFRDCAKLTGISIPDSVTYIGVGTFAGCTELTSVVIPDSVTYIDVGAFYGCVGLTNVVIPDSVTEIRWGAFAGCSGLTSVVIPDSVTKIRELAFSGCARLTSVSVPAKTQISGNAFPDTVRIERRA